MKWIIFPSVVIALFCIGIGAMMCLFIGAARFDEQIARELALVGRGDLIRVRAGDRTHEGILASRSGDDELVLEQARDGSRLRLDPDLISSVALIRKSALSP